ncbi:PREDICTED: growth-regulating factor 8 isoform X2 [Tarenaya hassleriana]|nr:PREDICTED: growth-regulating factor 8 isoform X2 [Tarenaya hassleriana]
MDLEPWRCRRTDGKKWRCSRNVIPDHKYCERHSHKNRPRSRKHVELPPHTVNHGTSTIAAAAKNNTTDQLVRTYLQNPNFYGQPETQLAMYPPLASASSSYDQHRGLRWFMKDDDASVMNCSTHELGEMIQLKVGSSQEPGRSNGNSLGFDHNLNFGQKEQLVSQSFGSVEGLMSLNQTHSLETRHFIDAFANEAMGSSLSLSMAGEVEGNRNEAVDGLMGSNHQQQWMCHEGGLSWLGSPPGGPLAEALCLGVSSNGSGCSISSATTSSCSRSSN